MVHRRYSKKIVFISIVTISVIAILLNIFDLPLLSTLKETIFISNNNGAVRSLWKNNFELVQIKSSTDGKIQKAYFYKSQSPQPEALLISLHTWSGDYTEFDSLAILSKANDINYIHPNFRGPNSAPDNCCSHKVLNDIDDAISYAIEHGNVDSTKIYVIGASGGGYAALCTLMKSKHPIAKFSAWVPISDLKKWYVESKSKDNAFAKDIFDCTSSKNGILNSNIAEERSPIYWETPVKKLENVSINIYAGINDGIHGSVSIFHSVNFYNKLLYDYKVVDSSKFAKNKEILTLRKFCNPLSNFGKISNRQICMIKKYRNIKLVLFEGGHEILTKHAFNELLE